MHRWVDHTSEVELEIEAATAADVFREGAAALADLLGDERAGDARSTVVEIAARDRTTLLADWLAELAYLAEGGFVAQEVAELELEEGRLRAVLRGTTATPRFLVKAVTYHRLELDEADDGWRARVVLDV